MKNNKDVQVSCTEQTESRKKRKKPAGHTGSRSRERIRLNLKGK
jgi:hypothetical protein